MLDPLSTAALPDESLSLPFDSLLEALDELSSAALELSDTLAELIDDASLSESSESVLASELLLEILVDESLPKVLELPFPAVSLPLEEDDSLCGSPEPPFAAESPPEASVDELLSLLLGSLREVLNELSSVPFELSDTLTELLDDASLSASLESVLASEPLLETLLEESLAGLLETLPLDALDASPASPFEWSDSLAELLDDASLSESLESVLASELLFETLPDESLSAPLEAFPLDVADELSASPIELPDALIEPLDEADSL